MVHARVCLEARIGHRISVWGVVASLPLTRPSAIGDCSTPPGWVREKMSVYGFYTAAGAASLERAMTHVLRCGLCGVTVSERSCESETQNVRQSGQPIT